MLLSSAAALAQDDGKPTFPLETIYAERKKNTFRTLLSKFHLTASTGYGRTFFKQDLDGFGIYQAPGQRPSLFFGTPPDINTRYTNWVNDYAIDTTPAVPGAFLVNSDTATLGFRGKAWNIPLRIQVHFEIKEKYRVGLGYSYEYMNMREFSSVSYKEDISSFRPDKPGGWVRRYYAMLGYSFYRIDKYLFTGDAQIGSFKPKSNFNASVVKPGLYYNLGVTVEREMSEYLRLFVRPSFEFKNYVLTLPETGKSIKHSMNAAILSVGFTYRIPELPRCFHKECRIQINHAHGNKEYRSRVHPVYKKQNPGYGENHPTLIKYKGKNKRRLNPY